MPSILRSRFGQKFDIDSPVKILFPSKPKFFSLDLICKAIKIHYLFTVLNKFKNWMYYSNYSILNYTLHELGQTVIFS